MSRIFFQKSYIAVFPSYEKNDTHKHPFLHLCFGKKGCKVIIDGKEIKGNIIVIDSNVKHTVQKGNGCDLILLIDPTSVMAEQLISKYLKDGPYFVVSQNICNTFDDILKFNDSEIIEKIESILLAMGVIAEDFEIKEERIEQVINNVISGEWLELSVGKIAEKVFLSESRLAHLFKEEVGISLKSYILIRKMERAYKFVSNGGKITRAAQESGFASSAHLAYTCKKMTGVSITDVLKSKT